MQPSANTIKTPAEKSLFPRPARASGRSMVVAFVLGVLLLLVPVPQLLAQAGIVRLPLAQLYNQSILNAAADTGAFVLLALGLNIVVGYAGLLDLGYAAFFAIGTYTYSITASSFFNIHMPFWLMLFASATITALFGVA